MKITPGADAYKPGVQTGGPVLSRTQMQKALARQAAMEAGMARYMSLECGHFTTLEEQQVYSLWRPKKGVAMCDSCQGAWVPIRKVRAPAIIPQEPLF